jgi:hydroxyethylthiazole kinase-like uncharacterized protein yjeF
MEAEMILVSPKQIREIDRLTIEEIGIPGIVLMERAALGACDTLSQHFPEAQRVVVLCGSGNNGGDGLAMARILDERGYDVDLVLVCSPEKILGDAATNLHICAKLGFEFFELEDEAEVLETLLEADVYVDALLGTGLDRIITEDSFYAIAIDFLNTKDGRVLSVDVPSGLHAGSGQGAGYVVRATATATFALPKMGLALEPGRSLAGDIYVIDIGIPLSLVEDVGWDAVWLRPDFLHLGKRDRRMHKGDAGRIVVLGGWPGHVGAALLAGRAALLRGAGLVTVATHASALMAVPSQCPELMSFDAQDHAGLSTLMAAADVVVVGPGLGQSIESNAALDIALQTAKRLVLDADGLNLLAERKFALPGMTVLTPHPGEASRLLGRSIAEIMVNPINAALDLATRHNAVVVLKGSASVVAAPDGRVGINGTGNPGMATGGMGDALAGIIASSLCESDDAFEATCHAVCLHGYAGDRAATITGQRGLTVTDLLDAMKRLWIELEVG